MVFENLGDASPSYFFALRFFPPRLAASSRILLRDSFGAHPQVRNWATASLMADMTTTAIVIGENGEKHNAYAGKASVTL